MNLQKLAELSIGLGASIGVLWIVLQMIRELRKPGERSSENGHSGSKPVSYWQQEFRKAVREELELSEIRTAKFFTDELRTTRHDLRDEIQKLVANLRN